MSMLYLNMCYKEVCYKWNALYQECNVLHDTPPLIIVLFLFFIPNT